ncbi:lysozyme inhibitor [Klebsiella michiganensis]|nr:lysozyme inhibitor [Klebsiella michiganensis]
MLKHLTAIAFLAASTHAMAQADMTLDGLAKKEPAAFSQMVKGRTLPAWIKSGGTGSPARTVKLGAEVYQVFSVCKPHDCAAERFAVLWSEKSGQMSGLYSAVDEKTAQETLTWLNVSDERSIDGKTVLLPP